MPDHANAIWQIAYSATQARRLDLLAALIEQAGCTVQAGPFAGTQLPRETSWTDGDLLPKLLGCYEAELHPVITEFVAGAPDLIINIGAAEGYYAIGLARLLPEAFVHAFDTSPDAQELCRTAAALNDVSRRVSVAGTCSLDLLNALLPRGRAPLIVCDCNGHEVTLIDPSRVPVLRNATMIVECHDFVDPRATSILVERLQATHDMVGVPEGPRNPNEFEFLQGLNSLDRWLAVCEFRPSTMHWLVARPKEG